MILSKPAGYRTCKTCLQPKPLEAFHVSPDRPAGRSYACAACETARVKAYYQALRLAAITHYGGVCPHREEAAANVA